MKDHSVGETGKRARPLLMHVFLLFFLLVVEHPAFLSASELSEGVATCSRIDDPAQRLECYDALAGRTGEQPMAAQPPAAESKRVAERAQEGKAEPSILSRQWDLEEAAPGERRWVRLYRTNYFLPFTYNTTPNKSQALDVDPNARAQSTEAQFQLSLKMKVWQDLLGKDVDLWFAYTQRSFWQVYNTAFSSPFRETDYEPEMFLTFRTDYPFLGLRGRLINIGLNHQSNGRSEPLSRSWNRIVATAGFERDGLNVFLKTWYRIPESSQDDDNPDIHRYVGYGELEGLYYWKGHRFGAMLRNNLQTHGNKGALHLDWVFPLPFMQTGHFKGYIDYFNGYCENLLDYDKSTNRIGFGFMLADW